MELHLALVNNKQQVELSATLEPTSTPSSGNIEEKDHTTPTLSDLQQDVIDNLELIAGLVKQVLVLDDRATKIFLKHKPEKRLVANDNLSFNSLFLPVS